MVENILVIDDELMICEAISSYLKKHGFNVFTANTGNDGLRILKEQEISFIFFQPENPWSLDRGMNGVTFTYCIFFT